MTDATRSQLEQAYRLIQQDNLDRAVELLRPIVAAQPNNLDAWWMLAHALSDPGEARDALSNVLRINPNHQEARDMAEQLDAEFSSFGAEASPAPFPTGDDMSSAFSSAPVRPSSESSVSSSELDKLLGQRSTPSDPGELFGANDASFLTQMESGSNMDFGSSDFDQQSSEPLSDELFTDPFAASEPGFVQSGNLEDLQVQPEPKKSRRDAKPKDKPKKEEKPRKVREPRVAAALDPLEIERRANRRMNPALVVALLIILVAVVGGGLTYALLPGLLNRPVEATIPVTPNSTQAVAMAGTAAATSDAGIDSMLQTTNDLFTANNFKQAKAAIVQSSLGDTFQVQVCGVAGPALGRDVNKAMDIVAREAAKISASVKAAGVEVVNCTSPDVKLYRAVAPIEAVIAYINGNMTDTKTYRTTWKRS